MLESTATLSRKNTFNFLSLFEVLSLPNCMSVVQSAQELCSSLPIMVLFQSETLINQVKVTVCVSEACYPFGSKVPPKRLNILFGANTPPPKYYNLNNTAVIM